MTKEIKLETQSREEKIEQSNLMPAVLYGPNTENKNLKLNINDFNKIYQEVGESQLIDLIIDNGKATKVIIKSTQKNPLKETFIHADFYQVDMNKKITAEVHFNFMGEAKAVKELGGTLIKNLESIEIECLPGDLIDKINIDLSKLENLGDAIAISDLEIPENVKIKNETSNIIVNVIEPRIKEEVNEETASSSAEASADKEKEEAKGEGKNDKKEEKSEDK